MDTLIGLLVLAAFFAVPVVGCRWTEKRANRDWALVRELWNTPEGRATWAALHHRTSGRGTAHNGPTPGQGGVTPCPADPADASPSPVSAGARRSA